MILGRGRGWGYGMSVVTEALEARTKYAKGGHEYWLEGTFQIGSFGAGTIGAWKHVQETSRRQVLNTWGAWLRWSTFLLNLATRRMAGMDPRSVGYWVFNPLGQETSEPRR